MSKAPCTPIISINKQTRIVNFGELQLTKVLATNLPRQGGVNEQELVAYIFKKRLFVSRYLSGWLPDTECMVLNKPFLISL
jgi:hypothetical protein